MITIVSGVPGSGKTFWAVDFMSKLPPDKRDKVLHNIDGCKIGRTFGKYQDETGIDIKVLFCNNFHEKDQTYRGFTFIIDEAQILFPKRFADREVLTFFEKHRHYGVDIILLTQDIKLLCPDLSLHAEYNLRATSDTANPIPFIFIYRKMVGWESVGTTWLWKRQKVFDLYKTADFDQKKVNKKAKPMAIIIIIAIICAIFGLLYLKFWVGDMGTGTRSAKTHKGKDTLTDLTITKEGKALQDMKNDNDKQKNKTEQKKTYSESFTEKIGGVMMPLSVLFDHGGGYVVFQEQILPFGLWPYQIVKTRFGYMSIVPPDVYEVGYLGKIEKSKEYAMRDPNEKYYYRGTDTNTNTNSQSAGKQFAGKKSFPGGAL